ncbi:unnamed protein product [Prorocentrum cordatum]|uniref:SCP domain-containing protein n=1 Tax=Prorocentrum cordatum TaxID=2364126 RepID=A0ABN9XS67_9DINO|nr:unnamed protein product [Polarella glacialis]
MAATQDWVAKTLKAHNDLRARHGAPPLQWSDECFRAAQVQASACQSRGALFHGSQQGRSGRHGQNAFFGSMPGADASDVVQMWYDEVAKYNFGRPGFAPGTGHFTQVVWAGSTHVGMARSADGRYVVANYFPAGNVTSPGCFQQNVMPAGTKAAAKPAGGASPAVSPSGASPGKASPGKASPERSGLGWLGRLGRPFRRNERPAPSSPGGGGRVLLGAGGAQAGRILHGTVKASGWTPEVLAALEGVPSPEARNTVQRGLAEGAAVTIERQAQSIAVTTEKAGMTRRWNMRWG